MNNPDDQRHRLRDLLIDLPWWARLIAGLAVVALGLWLMVRPLSSINILVLGMGLTLIFNGVSEGLQARTSWSSIAGAGALIATGIATLLFRGLTTSLLAVIIAVALIAIGVLRMTDAGRNGTEGKATRLILALAAILTGIIALAWPDVTLLVTAVAFGGWTVVSGAQLVWSAITQPRRKASVDITPKRNGWLGRMVRFLGAVGVLAVVAAAGVVSVRAHQGAPNLDDFYTAPMVAPSEPGVLLRAEPFTRAMPAGSQAWRILYTTTKADGEAALASALVIAPSHPAPRPMPMIAWAHGTTGYAQTCAPTLLPNPLTAGAMFTADQVVAHGWVMVASDYVGLGTKGPHPYLIGQGEGRSVLDSIRAAHQLKVLTLSDKTVIWGHSQGGHAALWAGGLAATYAPELDIAGVASLAPASDLPGLVANLDSVRGGLLFADYAFTGYAAAYPDVRDKNYVDPSAQTLVRKLSGRCLADPRIYVSVVEALAVFHDRAIFSPPLTTGPMLTHLQANTPTLPVRAPLLIAQGLSDPLVVPRVQRAYAQARCNAGQELEYLTVPDKDHVALVEANSPLIPQLFKWTQDRFDGIAVKNGCRSLPVG